MWRKPIENLDYEHDDNVISCWNRTGSIRSSQQGTSTLVQTGPVIKNINSKVIVKLHSDISSIDYVAPFYTQVELVS